MTRRASLLLIGLALAGCQARPVALATTPAAAPTVAEAWNGPTGLAALSVQLSAPAGRHVLWVPSQQATSFTAEVTGAGINGWLKLTPADATTTATFGAPGSTGVRVASLAAKVPAGDRRIFRVKVYDTTPEPDLLLDEIWGVGDIPANTDVQQTYPVTIKPMTTPTARIFDQLIHVSPAKALTLPIPSVQHYVEELTNTNWVNDAPLRADVPQVHPYVLDIEKATAPILRGNAGVPFQIPVPIPDDLLAHDPVDPSKTTLTDRMKRRAAVHLRVIDIHGQLVQRPFVFYVTDPATHEQLASDTAAAEATLDAVPGSWLLGGNDLVYAQTVRKPVTLTEGALNEAYMVAPPHQDRVAGDFNKEADAQDSFKGDQTPAELIYMNDLGAIAFDGDTLRYNDAGNRRLRAFDLTDALKVVTTFAGDGNDGTYGDGGPATRGRITVDDWREMIVDKRGTTYVCQANDTLRAIKSDGTITTFWAPTGWGYGAMSDLAYDAVRDQLYVGCKNDACLYRLDLSVFDGTNPALKYDGAAPGVNGIAKLTLPYGGWGGGSSGLAFSGDLLFASGNDGKLRRYNVTTQAVDILVGKAPSGPAGEDSDPEALSDNGLAAMAVDKWGNLFFRGNAGLYRLMNATTGTEAANTWRVKLIVPDGYLNHVVVNPAGDRVYYTTRDAFLNNGGTTRWVPVIKRLDP